MGRCSRVLAAACVAFFLAAIPSASGNASNVVVADFSLSGQSQHIQRGFFGFSAEDNEVNKYLDAGPLFDRMLKIMRPQDGSRMILRIGGRSSDEVYWKVSTAGAPHYVIPLTPAWLDDLGKLAHRDNLKLEFDLNMAVHSPRMAASFAKAALKAVGPGHLAGFGMGNEPDLYRLESWLEKERIPSTLASTPRHWTAGYTPETYRTEYVEYARAVLRAIPGIALTAPELTYPSQLWPTELLALGKFAPQAISFHRYATATCKKVNSHAPGVYAFLKDRYAGGLAKTLSGVFALTQSKGVPLRVTEMNSVTCGGRKHLAESFATALWAPDALFEMMHLGVAGVNWHIRPKLPNAPFHLGPNGVEPLPEAYGLAVFAQMLGPRARLEDVSITSSLGHRVKAWAVDSKNGLKLLLINKSGQTLKARVKMGNGHSSASVSRLVAPSAAAETGETFAGQTIGPDARWHGRNDTFSISPGSNGIYTLHMHPYSAAIVNFG